MLIKLYYIRHNISMNALNLFFLRINNDTRISSFL